MLPVFRSWPLPGSAKALATLPLAQVRNLRRQIPPLYALLAVNTVTMAWDYHTVDPWWLTTLVPSVLLSLIALRVVVWLRLRDDAAELSEAAARRWLHGTEITAAVFTACFCVWAMAIDLGGGAGMHGHFMVFAAITLMGTMFCLNYLPRAAGIACAVMVSTLLPYSMLTGPFSLAAITINLAFVCLVILMILKGAFASFVMLEQSQHDLSAERTQAQLLSNENARLALTDPLTLLPNRRWFFAHLEGLLARAEPFCVAVLDLDRFKPINDTLGHAQGDRLLEVIGARLRSAADPRVVAARLGGDEFGVIVAAPAHEAQPAIQALCSVVEQSVDLREATVSVGCSAGLAAWPEAGERASTLYDHADFALYHAKKHRAGLVVCFSAELAQMMRCEQALEMALHDADLTSELRMVFQPLVKTRTLETIGVEALARWTSPTMGEVPVQLLLSTAEKLGIARQVTMELFDKTLAAFDQLPAPLRMAFNLSAADMADAETIDAIVARMADRSATRGRLVFEITETSLIGDFAAARNVLVRLRQSGGLIALDDFGTGHFSLSALDRLPLDIIKIDRSFAGRLSDPPGRRLITGVRQLAAALDLDCVFEGIETDDQLIDATLAGFAYAQGYYFAHPSTLDAALERIGGDGDSTFGRHTA